MKAPATADGLQPIKDPKSFRPEPDSLNNYRRRDPSQNLIHKVVRREWPTFVSKYEESQRSLPAHVYREFESFLHCGSLASGLMRLKCESCSHEKLVAFSCKKRGFCNSCGSKKMSEQAAFLTDWVFPQDVRIRQWVLSFPIPMRYWMARNPALMGQMLQIFIRAISGLQRNTAEKDGFKNGESGFCTLVQRFGGSCNLNLHFHTLGIEAVYRKKIDDFMPEVYELPAPTTEEIQLLLATIQKRMVRALTKNVG